MTNSQNKTPSIRLTVSICLLIVALIMGVMFMTHHQQKTTAADTTETTILPTAKLIPPIKLITDKNRAFTEKNFLGHWTLLFFGFTHCPDICPTTLATLKQVYPELHARIPSLQIVFASIEPQQDTPATLQHYLRGFNADFIGITGTEKSMQALQQPLGIFSMTSHDQNTEHSTALLLINPRGKWVALLPPRLEAEPLKQAVLDSIRVIMSKG